MTAPVQGIADVQARIAAIEGRFAALAPAGAAAPAGGTTFAGALAQASGTFAPAVARTGTSPSRAPAAVTGEQVVADARRYLGVPYLWGGTDPAQGLDCSGLVQRVYADLGVSLPRTSQEQARVGQAVPDLSAAQPGDLVAFGDPATHIGIYAGNGQMLVAPHTGDVVRYAPVGHPTSIRRVLPDAAPSVPAGPYGPLFAAAGARYGVAPALLSAVARAESDDNPRAVSSAGAQGLMQLMPGTARDLGVDPFDPAQAVDGAARLLQEYLSTYRSLPVALAAYNAGPAAVAAAGGVPAYPETQGYIRTVLRYLEGASS